MDDEVRLNKYIADSGYCSRREADRLIESGKVTVNGRVAEMGERVTSKDKVIIDGKRIVRDEETILLIFNKPPGITCTTAEDDETNVVKYLNYPKRIYPIGRLDKYSEGLLLMTNKGELVNGIMRSRYGHEKEYVVTVDRPVTDELLRRLTNGIQLSEDEYAKPCFAEKTARNKFRMIITQGLNRQIRKMCAYFGYGVVRLVRVRVMNIELGNLKSGRYRDISKKEREELMGILDKSTLAEKDN